MNARIAVLFHRLGPYHHARLIAAGRLGKLLALEFSGVDATYTWDVVEGARFFTRVTLFHEADAEKQRAGLVSNKLSPVLDEFRPDVVAIPGWSSRAGLSALYWCLKTRTPAVVMSESTAHDERRARWREAIKRQIVRLYSAGLVGGTPHVEYLEALGLRRERIFTGYDVVDNAFFAAGADAVRQNADAVRQQLRLPDRYFLACNRFIQKKNLPRMLKAYARYRSTAGADPWKLVLLGDGPLKSDIVRLLGKFNLRDHVFLPGFKQYGELPAYYGLAGAFIHASTTEQWGLVVNEAMASGLPVIVSDRCGCAPDLVEKGENGFTFDPYDVEALGNLMCTVASDPCDRNAMGLASRKLINQWSPDMFAENLWKAVRSALEADKPAYGWKQKILLLALMRR